MDGAEAGGTGSLTVTLSASPLSLWQALAAVVLASVVAAAVGFLLGRGGTTRSKKPKDKERRGRSRSKASDRTS